jgi:hypothetical protein
LLNNTHSVSPDRPTLFTETEKSSRAALTVSFFSTVADPASRSGIKIVYRIKTDERGGAARRGYKTAIALVAV